MQQQFDHEKLKVYQLAVAFVQWLQPILKKVPNYTAGPGQLDAASTSMPLNIAEGAGKFLAKDRRRHFDMARSSALVCSACLDVLIAKELLTEDDIADGMRMLLEIVSMLVEMIKSNSPDRPHEPESKEDAGQSRQEIGLA